LATFFSAGEKYEEIEKEGSGYQSGKAELWFHKLKFCVGKQFNLDRKGFIGLSLTLS
jgi:hypothetical protein